VGKRGVVGKVWEREEGAERERGRWRDDERVGKRGVVVPDLCLLTSGFLPIPSVF
jgi:hypothetical protein